jgi:RNA recognition motif-containing protein
MDWPVDATPVPEYLVRGMSFDDMLGAYKKFVRTHHELVVDEEGDTKMQGSGERSLNLKKKGKTGGIQKETRVSKYESKRPPNGVPVFVKNIPYSCSEGELRHHFSHIGRVLKVEIDRSDNRKSLGTGTVFLSSRKEANVAAESLQNTRLGDRAIRVTLAE